MAKKTPKDKGRKGNSGKGVDLLEFRGDRDEPESLEKVMQRKPIAASGDVPKDFAYARENRTIYLSGGPRGGKPSIALDRAETADDQDYYRLTVPAATPDALHLPGRSATRQSPADIVREVDPRTRFTGARPKWEAGSFYPRPLPGHDRAEPMRNFSGRPVNPLYVFGPDDRRAYFDRTWPWGLTGKIITSGGWTGSGTLIGPRLVATAGHVVPWGSGPWWMRFIPAFYNGSSLHGAGVESYVSDAKGYAVSGRPTGYDWAVLRLYNPLGSWLGYFGYNGFSSSWEDRPWWTILGYPGMVASGQRPSYQNGISVFDIDSDSNGGRELETKGDVTAGNSGGPMFGWWNGDPRLVGVVSGEEEDWSPGFWPWDWADVERGNVVASGSGFTNLMAWGRTNWPL